MGKKEVSPDIVRLNLRMKDHALLGALATFVIRRMHTNQHRPPPSRLSHSHKFFLAFVAAVFLVVFSARRRALFRIVRLLLLLSPSYRSDRLRLQKPEAIQGVILHRKQQRLQQFSSSVHNRGKWKIVPSFLCLVSWPRFIFFSLFEFCFAAFLLPLLSLFACFGYRLCTERERERDLEIL